MSLVPVIAIDGPSASGKGTVAARVASALGYHYLDSGALYRLVALAALEGGIPLDDEERLAEAAASMNVRFGEGSVWLAGRDVSMALRGETVSVAASRVAAHPAVRRALLDARGPFGVPPGWSRTGATWAPSSSPTPL